MSSRSHRGVVQYWEDQELLVLHDGYVDNVDTQMKVEKAIKDYLAARQPYLFGGPKFHHLDEKPGEVPRFCVIKMEGHKSASDQKLHITVLFSRSLVTTGDSYQVHIPCDRKNELDYNRQGTWGKKTMKIHLVQKFREACKLYGFPEDPARSMDGGRSPKHGQKSKVDNSNDFPATLGSSNAYQTDRDYTELKHIMEVNSRRRGKEAAARVPSPTHYVERLRLDSPPRSGRARSPTRSGRSPSRSRSRSGDGLAGTYGREDLIRGTPAARNMMFWSNFKNRPAAASSSSTGEPGPMAVPPAGPGRRDSPPPSRSGESPAMSAHSSPGTSLRALENAQAWSSFRNSPGTSPSRLSPGFVQTIPHAHSASAMSTPPQRLSPSHLPYTPQRKTYAATAETVRAASSEQGSSWHKTNRSLPSTPHIRPLTSATMSPRSSHRSPRLEGRESRATPPRRSPLVRAAEGPHRDREDIRGLPASRGHGTQGRSRAKSIPATGTPLFGENRYGALPEDADSSGSEIEASKRKSQRSRRQVSIFDSRGRAAPGSMAMPERPISRSPPRSGSRSRPVTDRREFPQLKTRAGSHSPPGRPKFVRTNISETSQQVYSSVLRR